MEGSARADVLAGLCFQALALTAGMACLTHGESRLQGAGSALTDAEIKVMRTKTTESDAGSMEFDMTQS
jgi:hypothetical protein